MEMIEKFYSSNLSAEMNTDLLQGGLDGVSFLTTVKHIDGSSLITEM
jgi:hypothetical protein